MNRAVPALAVALLLLVSGCLGSVQAPEQHFEDDEIVSLVTDMNATDARTLYVAHWQTLANASSYHARYIGSEGGVVRYQRSLVVDRTDREYVEHWEDGERRYGDVYINESGHYRRYVAPGNETYQYEARTASHETFQEGSVFTSAVPLPDETVLERFDFEYVGRDSGAYVFEADGLVLLSDVEYPQFYWDATDVTNASARLVVDQRGFVRSYESTLTFERGGVESTTRSIVTVTAYGEASTERPGWVGNATAA